MSESAKVIALTGSASTAPTQTRTSPDGYQVLARKYRPSRLADLVGHGAMVQTLSNAFRSDRIAHAFLLSGMHGVGKTTTARILARSLNYHPFDGEARPTVAIEAPGKHCEAILAISHLDVIEIDAASHTGVDDIRDLIGSARYRPISARFKIYIIDEVHMLSKSAFNALLKTLEEPPQHAKFILATTEPEKVPITVLSRCQRFELGRIPVHDMSSALQEIVRKESAEAKIEALQIIAEHSDGSMRDALSLLDQAIVYCDGAIEPSALQRMLGVADESRIAQIFHSVVTGNVASAISASASLTQSGIAPEKLLIDLSKFCHALTCKKVAGEFPGNFLFSGSEADMHLREELSESLSLSLLSRAWQILFNGIQETRLASHPLLAAQMVLVRLSCAADLPPPEQVLKFLKRKEERLLPETDGERSAPVDTQSSGPPRIATSRPVIGSFTDVLAACDADRLLALKTDIVTFVHLISFTEGKIKLRLKDEAPKDLPARLTDQLRSWTGEPWSVELSQEPGLDTVRESVEIRADKLKADAKASPGISLVLEAFPDAKIASVTLASGT